MSAVHTAQAPRDAMAAVMSRFADGLRPETRMTVSEWADAHRVLSPVASASPGPWRTIRTPYTREIMDKLSIHDPVEKVVLWAGAQVSKTETGLNMIGYVMDHAPGPMLCVQPSLDMAKRFSRQRVATLIEDSPVLRTKVRPSRERDSGNSVLSKEFPGGIMVIATAQSATGLRSMPARYIFCDEVDAYDGDVGEEGDPVMLAQRAAITYVGQRKIYLCSTGLVKGLSRIEREYEMGDRRRYHVPCPNCGTRIVFRMECLKWDEGRPWTAKYLCDDCGKPFPFSQKLRQMQHGLWVPERTQPGLAASYHLPGLYSPWLSWEEIAKRREQAVDDETLKVFVNTIVGETWAAAGEAPDPNTLYGRREDYEMGKVPAGVLFLTAGVDVQRDRLEVEIVGWGLNRESWSIDYRVLLGDVHETHVWDQLTELLETEFYPQEGEGHFRIAKCAIDTGYATGEVYHYLRKRADQRIVFGVKGTDHVQAPLGNASRVDVVFNKKRLKKALTIWPVGSSFLKEEFYRNLAKHPATDEMLAAGQPHPNGYCHFPKYGEEHFKGIASERCVTTKDRKGRMKREWVVVYRRNEPLDCRNYARAAAAHLGYDLAGNRKDRLMRLAASFGRRGIVVEAPPEPVREEYQDLVPLPQPTPKPVPPARPKGSARVRPSSFMSRR